MNSKQLLVAVQPHPFDMLLPEKTLQLIGRAIVSFARV
jgi:hypothetical protein